MKLKAQTSPPAATSRPDARVPTTVRALLALGLWIGLAYGLAEGLEVSLLRLIPGALSWRNGNSAYVLWVAPLFYAVVFTFLALVAAGLSRLARTLPWDAVLVFITLTLGAFLGLTLPGKPFSDFAAAILSLGLGTELTRQYARRRSFFSALIHKSLPMLIGGIAAIALVTIAFGWARESIGMRKVAAAGGSAPNILLLIIDTQRADHLSAYGYGRETSPALAQLAQEGVLFENAYSTSSWTLPSHASLLTGRPLNEHRAGLMRRRYR